MGRSPRAPRTRHAALGYPESDDSPAFAVGPDNGSDARGTAVEARARRTVEQLVAAQRATGGDPWRELLGRLLSISEVQQLIGAKTVREVSGLVETKRLLALPTKRSGLLFPAFQFTHDGRLNPTIGDVIAILADSVVTPYMIASWLKSPNDDLGGASPVRWLELGRDPSRVLAEARVVAARLAE